ncbi:MAG: hypothetical protein ABUL71_02570 [Gemmatimonadota bacterium]
MSRIMMAIGAALILLGGIIIARGVQYSSSHNVVDLGGLRLSVDEKKPVSPLIGGVVALVGLGLVFSAGSRKR